MQIKKGDIVRSDNRRGNGFVHYILPDNTASVEFLNGWREWIHVNNLTKVEV